MKAVIFILVLLFVATGCDVDTVQIRLEKNIFLLHREGDKKNEYCLAQEFEENSFRILVEANITESYHNSSRILVKQQVFDKKIVYYYIEIATDSSTRPTVVEINKEKFIKEIQSKHRYKTILTP